MNRRTLSLPLALAAAALTLPLSASAADDAPGTVGAPETERTRYDFELRAVGGAFDGMGVRTDSGGVGILQLDLTPKFRSGQRTIEVPLRLDHRQTFGASLDETVLGAGVDVVQRDARAESGWLAGASYTLRPNWPDLYQPDGMGGLGTTDRYSHFQGLLGWHYWAKLGDGRNARVKVRYLHTVYPRDPNYDAATSVVHLAPRDNGTLKVDTSYRVVKKGYAYAVRLDGYFRQDFVLLAKNAGTGGTSRSNPKERLLGIEPQAEIELRSAAADVGVGLGYVAQVDTFAGYYSYTAPNPFVHLKIAPRSALSADLRAEAELRSFGPNSKSDTEDGKRLRDTRYTVKGDVRYRLVDGFSLVAEGSWTKRDTNFRDYVPGVYPSITSLYDIKWDYTNTMVTAGVEWKP